MKGDNKYDCDSLVDHRIEYTPNTPEYYRKSEGYSE